MSNIIASAHEMGHNFNMQHDIGYGGPMDSQIAAFSYNTSLSTTSDRCFF